MRTLEQRLKMTDKTILRSSRLQMFFKIGVFLKFCNIDKKAPRLESLLAKRLHKLKGLIFKLLSGNWLLKFL